METKAIEAYEVQGSRLLAHANAIMIVDVDTRELAVEFASNARRVIKNIKKEFRPDIDNAHQLHKDLLARLTKLAAPFKQAQEIVDREISRDYLEQERIQCEEKRKAREKADAEVRKQEAALAQEAEELIEKGEFDEAEVLVDSNIVVNPEVPVPEVQKTTRTASGSTTVKKDIKVEVVSKQDVIIAVFQGHLPPDFLDVNLGAAKRYAKLGSHTEMPGFKITETAVVSGRVG